MERQPKEDPRLRMQGCMLSLITGPGTLLGLETVQDCMKDDLLRPFLGQALLKEIMPSMGLGREVLDPLAIEVCRDMEDTRVTQPLALLLPSAVRAWEANALPLLLAFQAREERIPACLCMSLAALAMLLAGARRRPDGTYACLINGREGALGGDEEILSSFARMSCDMPPEAFSYAVLSDRAIWDRDLRQVPGLEDALSAQLQDLQLLGLAAALDKARLAAEAE